MASHKFSLFLIIFLIASAFFPGSSWGSGISVDSGLTPPEDRWITRIMGMYMERKKDPTPMNRTINKYTLNAVLAYGLRPHLTLMFKQPVAYRKMTRGGAQHEDTGVEDSSFSAKYGVWRRNTANYTLGLSTILGMELPTGSDAFTSDTWDLKPGIYISLRRGALASDLSLAYAWNGFADDGKGGVNPGDELALDCAVAYQVSIGEEAEISVAPVMEMSYKDISPDRISGNRVPNTGESVFYISPGLKFTKSSFILEALVQIPTWQDQKGLQLKRETGLIFGARFMF